jgi:hypothetical protein
MLIKSVERRDLLVELSQVIHASKEGYEVVGFRKGVKKGDSTFFSLDAALVGFDEMLKKLEGQ